MSAEAAGHHVLVIGSGGIVMVDVTDELPGIIMKLLLEASRPCVLLCSLRTCRRSQRISPWGPRLTISGMGCLWERGLTVRHPPLLGDRDGGVFRAHFRGFPASYVAAVPWRLQTAAKALSDEDAGFSACACARAPEDADAADLVYDSDDGFIASVWDEALSDVLRGRITRDRAAHAVWAECAAQEHVLRRRLRLRG